MNKPANVAHVVLAVPLDTAFRYAVPEELAEDLHIGHRVNVDFHHRRCTAFVVDLSREDPVPENLKPILGLEEPFPVFEQRDLRLARWIARRYLCTQGEVLNVMVPRLPRRKRKKTLRKDTGFGQNYPDESEITLTPAQGAAVEALSQQMADGTHHTAILHGITGSGKTEVYLRVIARALDAGRGAIVLEPEIALTPQTVERFRSRFGERVALLHSKQAMSERGGEWKRLRDGEAAICIGPRSAVFAPVRNLGLLVIDEEMETSYKQNETPRYHAREVAIHRARQAAAVVIIGSATPSLESYHAAVSGRYSLLELPERVGDRMLPNIEIVDMKEEFRVRKNKTMFSHRLRAAIGDALASDGQVMLFVNRRAYSTFIQCRDCGEAMRCRNCQISLKYHFKASKLRCHYCDYTEPIPRTCPHCGSRMIKYFGLGTEKVEREIKKAFPEARVARMDADAVSARHAHTEVLTSFLRGDTNILVGTQMIAKGHDFPSVLLVGVVAADATLNLPDFRSCERTFQLLTQVGGRAGRGQVPGKVIIQTYQPDHYAVRCCLTHDYQTFYRHELAERRELGYPPFNRLLNIIISGSREQDVVKVARILGDSLASSARGTGAAVLGPARAPHEKLRGRFRHQILLKSSSGVLIRALYRSALADIKGKCPLSRVRITPDFEPYQLM